MSINGINNGVSTYSTDHYKKTDSAKDSSSNVKNAVSSEAAVYEPSSRKNQNKVSVSDKETVQRLLQEADERANQLKDLVQKMLLKQGQTVSNSTDIYRLLREGKVQVDPATRAQAQADIAEDGYWGVEKTSERLVSFAMAVSGSDPEKADVMIAAVKKGFEQATKAWGDELPKISRDTLDATISKLEKWRDSIN